MPYYYTTYTTTAPIATAWAIQTYNPEKISVSMMHTTWSYTDRPAVTLFDGFVVGETGTNGKFITGPPPETMNYGVYAPFTTYRMPIPTGTETDTYFMDYRDCRAQATSGVSASNQVCYYGGWDTDFGEWATTSTNTFQALAVSTIYSETTVRSTTYVYPTGPYSGGGSYRGDNDNSLPPFAIALIVIGVVMIASAIFIFACVVYPREHKRGKQAKRLKGLFSKHEGPYSKMEEGNVGLVGAASPMGMANQSPAPTTTVTSSSTPPPYAAPTTTTSATADASLQQRMIAMESEMQALGEQLRLSQVTKPS